MIVVRDSADAFQYAVEIPRLRRHGFVRVQRPVALRDGFEQGMNRPAAAFRHVLDEVFIVKDDAADAVAGLEDAERRDRGRFRGSPSKVA